ncbi:hypothetical protein [Acetobacter sp.]|uniref:hypothetical protein n=1 Tax=Acetobacter sp. TaxID=440 RepID=UPI0039E9704D
MMRPSQLREMPPNFPQRPKGRKWKLYVLLTLALVYGVGWWWAAGIGRPFLERVRIPVKVVPWAMRVHAPPLPAPQLETPPPVVIPLPSIGGHKP